MSTRKEIVSSFYGRYDEDGRTTRSRHGQLEFRTTMNYIHRYASEDSAILEVGAGTGRYSIALASEGMNVTAVELVESNLAVLRENSKGMANIQSFQGDATDLSQFSDNTFDVTLFFGPMYHLYEKDEVNCAIDEAIRVTKPNGVILFAFISVFIDDIAMCPRWTLVDFYIDRGMTAPHMENSKEWCRLLDDCFTGKVDLIVTQKVSSVSSDYEEITFIARLLAAQKKPVGIYFISEDIYTLASYYTQDLYRGNLLPEGWEPLPEDELDRELLGNNLGILMIEDHSGETEESFAITHKGE